MLRLLRAEFLSEILPIGNSAEVLPKLQMSSAAELERSSRSTALPTLTLNTNPEYTTIVNYSAYIEHLQEVQQPKFVNLKTGHENFTKSCVVTTFSLSPLFYMLTIITNI